MIFSERLKPLQQKCILFFLIFFSVVLAHAQVGVGTTTPAASAQLEVSSTTKGFLPPRMTTTQRDAIASPAAGLTIYNTTKNAHECYNGTAWYTTVHYVGESYGGGTVFFVYDNGQHGLIMSPVDLNTGNTTWYNGTNKVVGTASNGLKGGEMNTTIIMARQMGDNTAGSFAARLCADYSVTVDGITYGDWYLPTLYELGLMYLQEGVVGPFTGVYWSSTEDNSTQAYAKSLTLGVENTVAKSNIYYVRAVRAF